MNVFVLPLTFIFLCYVTMVAMNERYALFATDRFPIPAFKWMAYAWLGMFMLGLCGLVVGSSLAPPTAQQLARAPFYSLFSLHFILFAFLCGWWALSGRPNVFEFLNIRRDRLGEATLIGVAVGVGGWVVTIMTAVLIGLLLEATNLLPTDPEPSPMIGWMAGLPIWKKCAIVFSAMTVEEFFFRGWLQKRVGLIVSTILFALAHSGFGQPLLLIGITVVSLIIGYTFYRTKNLVPGIVAHGVFDAIQLFVIIPFAFRMTGAG